jgi:hypothetical protein
MNTEGRAEPILRDGQPVAGRRDASFLHSPGWSGRYHVAVRAQTYLANSWEVSAACNPRGMLLIEDGLQAASEVDPVLRCRRAGCAGRWPQESH